MQKRERNWKNDFRYNKSLRVSGVEILDETRVSLSGKGERLSYIDIPRRNTSESRDEIISTRSKETKGNCTSAGKVKG